MTLFHVFGCVYGGRLKPKEYYLANRISVTSNINNKFRVPVKCELDMQKTECLVPQHDKTAKITKRTSQNKVVFVCFTLFNFTDTIKTIEKKKQEN